MLPSVKTLIAWLKSGPLKGRGFSRAVPCRLNPGLQPLREESVFGRLICGTRSIQILPLHRRECFRIIVLQGARFSSVDIAEYRTGGVARNFAMLQYLAAFSTQGVAMALLSVWNHRR